MQKVYWISLLDGTINRGDPDGEESGDKEIVSCKNNFDSLKNLLKTYIANFDPFLVKFVCLKYFFLQVISDDVTFPQGIAVDYIGNNIYFSQQTALRSGCG